MAGLNPQVATNFTHHQTTADTTWTLVHNLGRYPVVDVFVLNNSEIERILPLAVTYVDANTCTVTFSTARTGYASVV